MNTTHSLKTKFGVATFQAPILKVLEIEDRYVVLLKYNAPGITERNVICVDAYGAKLWEIEPGPIRPVPGEFNPYTGIDIENGKLVAFNPAGYLVEVSLADGRVTPRYEGRLW